MELVALSVFIVFVLAMSIAYAAMARTAWHDAKAAKRSAEIADLQYEVAKAKYEAWLEANQKVGGSE